MATDPLEMAIATQLGAMIREARESKGWTQFELSARADVAPSTIALYEGGRRLPIIHNFAKIAHALGWEKRKIADFVDLAWEPLPYGRIGQRLVLLPPKAKLASLRRVA